MTTQDNTVNTVNVVKVKLFAAIREKVNKNEIILSFDTDKNITGYDILDKINLDYPSISKESLNMCRLAYNHKYIKNLNEIISAEKSIEVSLISPVSGG